MCEIFYMRNKAEEPVPRHRIRDLVDMALIGSRKNPDGTGAFNEDGAVFKTEDALHEKHPQEIVDLLEGSREIVLHLRMATTGSCCSDNAHPFEYEGHVMVHNGVMRRTTPNLDDSTDSEEFLHQTVNRDTLSTVQKIEESAERVRGSFSIFHRNLETRETFYFRDRSSFTFAETARELIGATVEKRLDHMDRFRNSSIYEVRNRFTPEQGHVYSMEQGYPLEKVGEFEKGSELEYAGGSGKHWGYSQRHVVVNSGSGSTRSERSTGQHRNRGSRSGSRSKNQRSEQDLEFDERHFNDSDAGMSYDEYKRRRLGRDGWDDNPWDDGSIEEMPPWME